MAGLVFYFQPRLLMDAVYLLFLLLYDLLLHLLHLFFYIHTLLRHLYLRMFPTYLSALLSGHSLQSSLPLYHMAGPAFRLHFVLQPDEALFHLPHLYRLLLHFLHSLFDSDRLLQFLLLSDILHLHWQEFLQTVHSLASLPLSLLLLYMAVQAFLLR